MQAIFYTLLNDTLQKTFTLNNTNKFRIVFA